MSCQLAYIPPHLHRNGRPLIDTFSIGELLFHRCEEEVKQNPFDNISLVDLSVNRSGCEKCVLSYSSDVLYNTHPTLEKKEEIFTKSIATLKIIELDEHNKYYKEIYEPLKEDHRLIPENEVFCVICLKHKPNECNYVHCAFEFLFMGTIEVTFENYKITLGKKSSSITKLRTRCKQEISKMIIKEEVKINF